MITPLITSIFTECTLSSYSSIYFSRTPLLYIYSTAVVVLSRQQRLHSRVALSSCVYQVPGNAGVTRAVSREGFAGNN